MEIKDFIRTNTLWFFYNLYLSKVLSDFIDIEGGKVLDFGCGNQHLRTFVFPKNEYIGYDIVKEVSMVGNYYDTKPDVAVASNVFEHMEFKDIKKFILFCKETGVKKIICSFPIHQWLWIWLIKIVKGKQMANEIIKDHITTWKDCKRILSKYFKCVHTRYYGISQIITIWE